MTIDDLVALFNKENKYYEYIVAIFRGLHGSNMLCAIQKKDKDLVEVIERLKSKRMYPIVDKGLGVVLGVDTHMAFCSELFRYYYYATDADREHVDPYTSADRYVSEGHGYFISRMKTNVIIVGSSYRPDRYDKDLFMTHEIDSAAEDPAMSLLLKRLSR